jgi:rare lipoprotein A
MRLWGLLGCLVLSGCTSINEWVGDFRAPAEPAETPVAEAPDGPPLLASVDVFALPEPEPRDEPLAKYGNPPEYAVDGITYRVTPVEEGFSETGVASWYGRKFHGRLTSSGEPFDMFTFTAAHKTMPIPAWVRVTNLENNQSLVVRVNDRGPFKQDRVLDLSWAAAKRLGFDDRGTTAIRYEVLEIPSDAPGIVANPLVKPVQAVLQVTAVSSDVQAQKIADDLARTIAVSDASVRVEATGTGLYRVQVLPQTDESVIQSVMNQLIGLGWSPQRLVARSEQK